MNAVRNLLGAVVILAAGGCATQEPSETARRPAMPTVAPAPVAPRVEAPLPESERVAQALRQARAGEFPAAVRTLFSGTDVLDRARLARQVATALSEDEPNRSVGFALANPPGLGQAAALEVAATALARRDADAALDWALGLSEVSTGIVARRAVAQTLVTDEARATVDRVIARLASPARDELLGYATAAWARRDADAALAWTRGLPEGELRTRLVSGVGFELAQTNPDRAITVAESLPAGRNRWLLTGAAAQTWVVKDPKAAFAWANQLPVGEARDAAYAGFDTGLGTPSKRRVANAPGTRTGLRSRGGTAASAAWREGDAPGFELWLRGQGTGWSRDEAILEYVRQRGAVDPRAIGQWLSSMPASTTRDQALQVFVENVASISPREAASFLQSLPRSEQTPEMMERTARRLMIADPAAAERWINDSTLPEFRKQELLREVRR